MNDFSPWTKELLDKAVKEYGNTFVVKSTRDDSMKGFEDGVRWAIQQIKQAPRAVAKKPYGTWVDDDEGQFAFKGEHWECKLVGIRKVEE